MTPARLATIKEILDAFSRSGAEELEIADGGLRLKILRRRGGGAFSPVVSPPVEVETPAPIVEAPSVEGILVTAAMHGVFHRAPAPGEAPFVSEGGRVARGQQLCILEAMKVFNAVAAPQDGVVTHIHAENGADVMAGQPLFTLEAVQRMAAE